MGQTNTGGAVKTTNQSLAILEYIEEANSATIAEIMDEFNLPKSTAHNHLSTLYENEYLTKFGEQYTLGMKLLGMGESARTRNGIFTLASKKVTELASEIEEGVDFCILEQRNVYAVYNEVINPNDPHFRMGKRFHTHASAAGKAILSKYSERKIEEVLSRIDLVELTENTITSETELKEELNTTEQRGFAYTDEEYSKGLRAVAVPVMLPDGRVLGALSVGGPSYRFKDEFYHEQIPEEVISTVDELEEQIASQYLLDID